MDRPPTDPVKLTAKELAQVIAVAVVCALFVGACTWTGLGKVVLLP